MKRNERLLDEKTHNLLIDEVVKEMWKWINTDYKLPQIQRKAKELKSSDKVKTLQNIYNFIVDFVPYEADPPGTQILTRPLRLLTREKVGENCAGMTLLAGALAQALGYEVRIVTIAWRLPEFTHVILEAKANGKWYIIDATMGHGKFNTTVQNIHTRKNYHNNMQMKLVTLEDCGCQNSLQDCGCGGKKKAPVNQNIINIGNDLSNYFRNSANQHPTRQQIQSARPQTQIVEKIVEKPVIQRVVERVPVDMNNTDAVTAFAGQRARDLRVPVRVLEKDNTIYSYQFGY